MAPGTVRVRILSGTMGEGSRHMAPGEIHELPAGFAQSLIQRQRARVVTEDEESPVKPQHGDPVAQHGDPKPRTRR